MLLKGLFRGSVLASALTGMAIGTMHFYYHPSVAPKPYPFHENKNKEKNIVVVGGGVIGLAAAYYLSSNPLHKITLIERNKKPY